MVEKSAVMACCVLDSLYYWSRFSGGNVLAVTILNGVLNVLCFSPLYLYCVQPQRDYMNV